MHCPQKARKVTGRVIYPHRADLQDGIYWYCNNCEAYVGSHKSNGRPLGRPANAALRKERQIAHSAFDPLWKKAVFDPAYAGSVRDNLAVRTITQSARHRCYDFLAYQLKLTKDECHIGMFDAGQCRHAAAISRKVNYGQIREWHKRRFPKTPQRAKEGPFDELKKLK